MPIVCRPNGRMRRARALSAGLGNERGRLGPTSSELDRARICAFWAVPATVARPNRANRRRTRHVARCCRARTREECPGWWGAGKRFAFDEVCCPAPPAGGVSACRGGRSPLKINFLRGEPAGCVSAKFNLSRGHPRAIPDGRGLLRSVEAGAITSRSCAKAGLRPTAPSAGDRRRLRVPRN